MAEYRITYWKDIPAQVEAFAGEERVRMPLAARFQALIDAAAMRQGLDSTEAYLQGWRVGDVASRLGLPLEVAAAVAAELEAQFEDIRATALG